MKMQFVPYELAVRLKELGFDEPCIAYYVGGEDRFIYDIYTVNNFSGRNILISECIATPLWQQAFDWFRKEYNLFSSILISGQCDYQIYIHKLPKRTKVFFKEYPNNIIDRIIKITYDNKDNIYEKAREACLIKLIELCKKN